MEIELTLLDYWTYSEVADMEFDDNGNYFFGFNVTSGKKHNECKSHITFASTFYLFGDNLDETKLFIPPGHTRANRFSNPKYPSQFRDSNNCRDSQISPGHRSGQIEMFQ
ncbi:unnamed protein product [Allacma fusca]|uniref:Uncharacterized protein n=1 Tax=Allacma fusca TaxID=39272 RepID=A0A8J2KRC7_9HEXA|nr:unnamed protein product [Allacma fusca]